MLPPDEGGEWECPTRCGPMVVLARNFAVPERAPAAAATISTDSVATALVRTMRIKLVKFEGTGSIAKTSI